MNKNGSTAEMIRLNTALPATPKGMQTSLGAALCFVQGALKLDNPGCDPAGFPNGRRPGDDTVDIALRVAMGYLLPAGATPLRSARLHRRHLAGGLAVRRRLPLPDHAHPGRDVTETERTS